MRIQKMTRTDAESNLEFIGFIIFENKLKPKSADTISELKQANIRNIMCTGDNILTAISVARECGILGADEPCFIPRFIEGSISCPFALICINSSRSPTVAAPILGVC